MLSMSQSIQPYVGTSSVSYSLKPRSQSEGELLKQQNLQLFSYP